jgi:SAM-dependent methyltransferase
MMENPEFLDPPFNPNNLDRYIVRSSILKAFQETLPQLQGTLLDVGCGQMPYKPLLLSEESNVEKYIGIDLEGGRHSQRKQPDLLWDGKTIPLEDESIDCAIATEVFEHCPNPEIVMKEIWRVLKPGGILFFTVPFLWNLHETPHDEYRYTPFALQRHLTNSGFTETEIKAMGGWDASLAQLLGLWVRRRLRGGGRKRQLLRGTLSQLLLPVIKFLYERDRAPEKFKEGTMITGLKGTAKK